jgi:hypothetical protein
MIIIIVQLKAYQQLDYIPCKHAMELQKMIILFWEQHTS